MGFIREYFLWVFKLITVLALLLFIIPGLIIGISIIASKELETMSSSKTPGKEVAVVELTGEILDSKEVLKNLYRAIEDDDVTAVVLRIDSPGGAVAPSQDIYHAVAKLKGKKPIVASMGAAAASGGLYAAVSASKIFAQPGTLTGSIGVLLQLPNVTQLKEKVGVDIVTITSGSLKDAGNMFREMKPEEREYFQVTVDEAYLAFLNAVATSRNIPVEQVRKFADGRVILGSRAKALGLIDEIGDIYDAATSAVELSGASMADGEIPKLRYYEDRLDKFFRYFESLSEVPKLLGRAARLDATM